MSTVYLEISPGAPLRPKPKIYSAPHQHIGAAIVCAAFLRDPNVFFLVGRLIELKLIVSSFSFSVYSKFCQPIKYRRAHTHAGANWNLITTAYTYTDTKHIKCVQFLCVPLFLFAYRTARSSFRDSFRVVVWPYCKSQWVKWNKQQAKKTFSRWFIVCETIFVWFANCIFLKSKIARVCNSFSQLSVANTKAAKTTTSPLHKHT